MSTLKTSWQQCHVVLKVSCVCSFPCTATMQPPCEITLVAPLFIWQLQWGKRPFWGGCWRRRVLTWRWKIKNPAGLLFIAVLSTDRFTVSYYWSRYVFRRGDVKSTFLMAQCIIMLCIFPTAWRPSLHPWQGGPLCLRHYNEGPTFSCCIQNCW